MSHLTRQEEASKSQKIVMMRKSRKSQKFDVRKQNKAIQERGPLILLLSLKKSFISFEEITIYKRWVTEGIREVAKSEHIESQLANPNLSNRLTRRTDQLTESRFCKLGFSWNKWRGNMSRRVRNKAIGLNKWRGILPCRVRKGVRLGSKSSFIWQVC